MNRNDLIDLLRLLSALESSLLTSKANVPDYLLEWAADVVAKIKAEALK